jgi:DNA polymerase V
MKLKKIHKSTDLEILVPDFSKSQELTIVDATISAGFPSPAEDYSEERLDLNKKLVLHPASTFYVRVNGDSMGGDGIHHGDLLVVDKSLPPKDSSILVCFIDGEFTLKRLVSNEDGHFLMPSNPKYSPIKIDPENDFRLWGVVTYSIKKHY